MRVGKYVFLNCALLLVGLKFQAISLVAQFLDCRRAFVCGRAFLF